MKGKLLSNTLLYEINTRFGKAKVRRDIVNGIEADTEVVEVEGKDIDDLTDGDIDEIITVLDEALQDCEIEM